MNSPSTPKKPVSYPLAYTEGHTWFYGRKFAITPSVLIPRPETEIIIDVATHIGQNLHDLKLGSVSKRGVHAPTSSPGAATATREDGLARETSPEFDGHEVLRHKTLRILDIGTGSGIIAITLALELPKADITATDISPSALAVAQQNANHHEVQISFLQSDLLSEVTGTYDIITANLPYVDKSWDWLDHPALSHEPPLALFAPDHGLALIKKLIQQAPAHLSPHGTLILEHDPIQFQSLKIFAKKHGFTSTPNSPYVTSLKIINKN